MTIYYICSADDLADKELSQTNDEQIACEILKAARVRDEIWLDLLAIDANSANGTYAQLKDTALYSIELTAANIQIWQTEGAKIFEYLLCPDWNDGRLWCASRGLGSEMEDYEWICRRSSHFNRLPKKNSLSLTSQLDENIREEQSAFIAIMDDLYAIKEIKPVTS